MKKINLLKSLTIATIGLFASHQVIAQTPLKGSIATNLGATRFVVTAPSTVFGIKKVNYASWGAAASPTIFNMPVEKAYDTLGATTLLNGTGAYPPLAGKFALIFRGGGITFSQKVKACTDAGAIGVIIVNNIPGDPVGMAPTPAGSTVSVPVMMISDVDGLAINNAIKSSPSDTVKVTIGTWNTGGTHDLGIVSRYIPLPSALNIPFSQISGSTAKVYNNHYMAGAIANYGTATETGVVVTDSVYWTPKGSATRTFITKNSYNIPSISPTDSIKFGFDAPYTIAAPTTAGKYEHVYSINYSNTDDFPQDNTFTLNQYITDSVYAKVPLNPTTGEVIFTGGYGPSDGASSTISALVGSMMYVNNNDLTNIKYVQYSVSKDGVSSLDGDIVYAHLLKWTDTAGGGADSFVQASELKAVAISASVFKVTDSSGDIFTSRFLSLVDPSDPSLKVELNADSWYAVVVEVPAKYFLGYNESHSTFTRGYAQFVASGSIPGSAIGERDEIARFGEDLNTALGTAGNFFVNYPFGAVASSTPPTNNFFVDSIFYDRYNKIPAIALITTPNDILGVSNKVKQQALGIMNVYPVPASNKVTVELNLELAEKSVDIRLFDALGRSVYSEKRYNVLNDKFDIDLTKLSSGSYHLVAGTSKGLIAKSVIVTK